MKVKYILFFISLFLVFNFFICLYLGGWKSIIKLFQIEQEIVKIENQNRVERIEITAEATYGILMAEAGVDPNISSAIFDAAKDIYDLSNIRVGRTLDLYYDRRINVLIQLVYQIDSEEELFVTYHILHIPSASPFGPRAFGPRPIRPRAQGREVGAGTYQDEVSISTRGQTNGQWIAERKKIDYQIKIKMSDGVVATSLYQAALDKEIDIRAIIDLADAYQWTIDFAVDPRVGDTFKFIYEERYRDGQYIMPGKILAARYVNDGTPYQIFYFAEDEELKGYYDENGVSVQKDLLKAPIQYKYISSGFTSGLRCLELYGLCTNHRAIDYAAAIGTPVRAVGDGTVVYAGWNSRGYGNYVSIRHNDTYTTNYTHLLKILVKYGQKVKQGEIIGKVGSTGLSTGPHLHYEIVKHGVKINPLTLELPPGEPIKEENKERYFKEIEKYRDILNE